MRRIAANVAKLPEMLGLKAGAAGGKLRQAALAAAADAADMRWLLEAASGALNIRRH